MKEPRKAIIFFPSIKSSYSLVLFNLLLYFTFFLLWLCWSTREANYSGSCGPSNISNCFAADFSGTGASHWVVFGA